MNREKRIVDGAEYDPSYFWRIVNEAKNQHREGLIMLNEAADIALSDLSMRMIGTKWEPTDEEIITVRQIDAQYRISQSTKRSHPIVRRIK